MAEIVEVEVVSRRKGEGFECQMCEVAWIPKDPEALTNPAKRPRRCANPKCRSMRWDREKYPHARPPKPPDPNGGGGISRSTDADGQSAPRTGRRTCYQTSPLKPSRRPPTSIPNLIPAGGALDALAS